MAIGFPFPFAGYFRGLDAAIRSPIAVAMWGILFGGFVVQGLAGGFAGTFAFRAGSPDQKHVDRLTTWCALVAATPGLFVLSVLFRFVKW